MTIERGRSWGRQRPLAADAPVVADDAALRHHVEISRRAGERPPAVGLIGGDLCRTLGGLGDVDRLRSAAATTFTVDVVRAVVDERRELWFAAHLVGRRPLWWGWAVVAMNAQWCGEWDLGPRSHPGDGLLDLTSGSLPLGDRLEARRRARSGSHLPHPALRTSRVSSIELALPRALTLRLDGVVEGRARHLFVAVEPDALEVTV